MVERNEIDPGHEVDRELKAEEHLPPSVTVVICCYSGEPFFQAALDSVCAQTYPRVRILLHDNGCRPSYRERIERAAKLIGAEVVRSEVNRYGEGLRYDVLPGLVDDFVAILHDDDVFDPRKLEESIKAIVAGGLDYVFTDRQCVDEAGNHISGHPEGLNTNAVLPGDFPHRMLMELFHGGLRLHFSTFVVRTELARLNLLGDPYVPRIADGLFFVDLLLNQAICGDFIDRKLTSVRIHGKNDFLYSKFTEKERAREEYKLNLSEYFVFQRLVMQASTEQLKACFEQFPGLPTNPEESRVELLVRAGLLLKKWPRAKKLMAAFCFHEAFRLDPRRMMESVRVMKSQGSDPSGDANSELSETYEQFVSDEFSLFQIGRQKHIVIAGSDAEVRTYLNELIDSTSWKITAPLRALVSMARAVFHRKI